MRSFILNLTCNCSLEELGEEPMQLKNALGLRDGEGGERAALEGVLADLQPRLSIEIGTAGNKLVVIFSEGHNFVALH